MHIFRDISVSAVCNSITDSMLFDAFIIHPIFPRMAKQILHRTVPVNGIDIFYREAGDPRNPALLLLHGFPASSAMFKNLMAVLSDKYHLIAPDYPGFGFSAFPEVFDYTFKGVSECMNDFTDAIGLKRFFIYLHDYGSPIGMRICIHHPEKIEGIIVQNGNSYDEGNGPGWDETIAYWKNPTPEKKDKIYAFLSESGTREQYYLGLPEEYHPHISPELWMLDWERMQRPGNLDMQYVLNCDYLSNFSMFPLFQEYFRTHLPPALVIWGKYDPYFSVDEAPCYKRDLPEAQIHILDGSHMLLESHFEEMYQLIAGFLEQKKPGN